MKKPYFSINPEKIGLQTVKQQRVVLSPGVLS